MRKWMALALVLALCACAPALAEGVSGALGLTGAGESASRGDLSARTATDLYVVVDDGSDKELVRISRNGGVSVRVEGANSITDVVATDELVYFLRVANGTTALVRRNTDSTRTDIYTFPLGGEVGTLSEY